MIDLIPRTISPLQLQELLNRMQPPPISAPLPPHYNIASVPPPGDPLCAQVPFEILFPDTPFHLTEENPPHSQVAVHSPDHFIQDTEEVRAQKLRARAQLDLARRIIERYLFQQGGVPNDQTLIVVDAIANAMEQDRGRPAIDIHGDIIPLESCYGPQVSTCFDIMPPNGHGFPLAHITLTNAIGNLPPIHTVSPYFDNETGLTTLRTYTRAWNAIARIVQETDPGRKIIIVSPGGLPNGLQTPELKEIIDTITRQANVLIVASTGNDPTNPTYRFPAVLAHENERVLAVAASDINGGAPYNPPNLNPNSTVLAAGIVKSTGLNGEGFFQGTSFSVTSVAETVRLIWQANPSLTAEQVRQIIIDTTDDIGEIRALDAILLANPDLIQYLYRSYLPIVSITRPADDPANHKVKLGAYGGTPPPLASNNISPPHSRREHNTRFQQPDIQKLRNNPHR